MTTTIPAITIWQPWASLIAIGAKPDETRSWRVPVSVQQGSTLAIHAATRGLRTCWAEMLHAGLSAYIQAQRALGKAGLRPDELPLGAVVAVCRLKRCLPTEFRAQQLTATERLFGDYSAGRYAWELELLLDLSADPVPARGKQGLWEWTAPRWP